MKSMGMMFVPLSRRHPEYFERAVNIDDVAWFWGQVAQAALCLMVETYRHPRRETLARVKPATGSGDRASEDR